LKNEMIVVVGSEKYVVGDTDFFNEAKSYKWKVDDVERHI
jgi:hypothetical protein